MCFHRRDFGFIRMERIQPRKDDVTFYFPGSLIFKWLGSVYIALTARWMVSSLAERSRVLPSDFDILALPSMRQTARIAQERLTGSQYRRGEKTIHLMNDLIRLLNHGQLVVANRYHFGLKGGDICRG